MGYNQSQLKIILNHIHKFQSFLSLFLFLITALVQGQVKALVGGTSIDGYGNAPIPDSVILIEGDVITAVGTQAEIKIPKKADIIAVKGDVLRYINLLQHVNFIMINGKVVKDE